MCSILCSEGFVLQSEMSICWEDSSGPEDSLALWPIMVILKIICVSVTEPFLNALSTFIALAPCVHPSLVEKSCSLWDQAAGSLIWTCFPDRDQSRSSPGRVREMCEVCVQRHCCAVHLAALLRAHRNKKQSRFPRVGPQSQAQGCEPAHEASLGRSDLTAAVSLPSASPCGCAALQLG